MNVFCILYGATIEELCCFYLHGVPLKTQHRILSSIFLIFAKFYAQMEKLIILDIPKIAEKN